MRTKKKKKAVQLFNKGTQQKQIALELGVTEKTIGIWLKPIKARKKALDNIQTGVLHRISKAIKEGEPPQTVSQWTGILKDIRHEQAEFYRN